MVAERLRALLARRASGADGAVARTSSPASSRSAAADWIERLADEEAAALVTSAFRFYAGAGPRPARACHHADVRRRGLGRRRSRSSRRACPIGRSSSTRSASGCGRRASRSRAFLHPIVAARRDATGRARAPRAASRARSARESFIHVALDPIRRRRRAASGWRSRCGRGSRTCALVTDDFAAMVRARAGDRGRARGALRRARPTTAPARRRRWPTSSAGWSTAPSSSSAIASTRSPRATDGPGWRCGPGSGLGLLRREERSAFAAPRAARRAAARRCARGSSGGRLLTVAKTIAESPVHRRARMDDIGVRQLDADGRVVGERRFLGLFTSQGARRGGGGRPAPARACCAQILAAEQVLPGSHDYKEIVAVFNALPKSELLASTPAEVRADIRAVLAAQRAEDVVGRRCGRTPTAARVVGAGRHAAWRASRARRGGDVRDVLAARLGGALARRAPSSSAIGERALAPLRASRRTRRRSATPRVGELRDAIVRIVRTWDERLAEAPGRAARGGGRARSRRASRAAFPDDYRAAVAVERAAEDVALLAEVARQRRRRASRLRVDEGRARDRAPPLRRRASRSSCPSACRSSRTSGCARSARGSGRGAPAGAAPLHVHDVPRAEPRRGSALDAAAVASALARRRPRRARRAAARTTSLNRLVLEAGLDWRAVDGLRDLRRLRRAGRARAAAGRASARSPSSRSRRGCSSSASPRRFAPGGDGRRRRGRPRALPRRASRRCELLREDLLLRALLDVVEATVRTTFFAPARSATTWRSRSAPRDLAHLPPPRPLYEIYVARAARGGHPPPRRQGRARRHPAAATVPTTSAPRCSGSCGRRR